MARKLSTLFLLLLAYLPSTILAQSIPSPESFLGYAIGTKYTPHYKVVQYFEQVAKAASSNVKYINYGTTNEGKALTLAFVSSAANITNLETIRTRNLQTAKLLTGNGKPDAAIVWLSYNVHGNEPSSTEAAMQTLYDLVTKHTNDWLTNTVVIIDPCLNPDGRDRYVNWFNTTVGLNANNNPYAREHAEPWPGGRVNHYYFDLNRDWAWQTQIETQKRIAVYGQWMPHVHVDFHEQGINEPYYFAPAAEPMHEVITPWQVAFQTIIGKNNAQYFDANGWYYFTKERFDLFYPSYGDTYPTYNGSIGMTYEQGGHSRGGLSIIKDNGDTLTLVDRVKHHTVTGLSTVEASSKNAAKLIDNFGQYFSNSVNAIGSNYKGYVLTSNNYNRLQSLKELLNKNAINNDWINKFTGNGLNYANDKVENILLEKYTLIVSAYQPKSLLAKVLLEPKSKLNDTATYDITAWSLPYVYGVKAYALTDKIPEKTEVNDVVFNVAIPYADYALYVAYDALVGAKTLAALTANKVKVYINEKDITIKNKVYKKGTIIIPKKDNLKSWATVERILADNKVQPDAITSGFVDKGPDLGSPDIKFIAAPRIACVTGEEVNPNASGEVWHFYEQEMGYPVTMINSSSLRLNALRNFDVVIMPDGYYSALSDKASADDLKTWIKSGGRVVAIEGAANQFAALEWGVKLKKADEEKEKEDDKKKNEYAHLKKYGNRERDEIPTYIPGAIYEAQLDETHPIAFGYDSNYYTLKQNSNLLEFSKDAWNVGVIKKSKKLSGFAGYKVNEKLNDGTIIAVQDLGNGAIIYFVDNPIFRSFWQNGKLLFFNAAFLVGNNAVRL
jgi:hypothetical protein